MRVAYPVQGYIGTALPGAIIGALCWIFAAIFLIWVGSRLLLVQQLAAQNVA